jgi:hypothetical protein
VETSSIFVLAASKNCVVAYVTNYPIQEDITSDRKDARLFSQDSREQEDEEARGGDYLHFFTFT